MKTDLPFILRELHWMTKKFGYFRGFIVPICILLGLLFGGGFWEGKATSTTVTTTTTTTFNGQGVGLTTKNPITVANADQEVDKEFSKFLSEWIIANYSGPDENNFYCVNSWSPFLSPDIIYRTQIPALFKSLYFRYLIKNNNQSSSSPQTFIFSLGEKNSRIFRIYLPQTNPQSVGFERFNLSNGGQQTSSRDHAQELDDPIMADRPVEVTISAQSLAGGKIHYNFDLKYISKNTKLPTENSLGYDVDLQDPDPSKIMTQLGVGTFKGNCIQFDRYNFVF